MFKSEFKSNQESISVKAIEQRPLINIDNNNGRGLEQTGCCQKICDFIKNYWKWLLLATVFICLLSLLAFPPVTKYIEKTVTNNLDTMRTFKQNNEILTYTIAVCIIFPLTFIFPRMIPNITTAFILKDLWGVTLLMYITLQLAICIGFFSVRYCCYKKVHDLYKDNENFEVLDSYSKETPWKASWIVWC